jgi:hypothetical protein
LSDALALTLAGDPLSIKVRSRSIDNVLHAEEGGSLTLGGLGAPRTAPEGENRFLNRLRHMAELGTKPGRLLDPQGWLLPPDFAPTTVVLLPRKPCSAGRPRKAPPGPIITWIVPTVEPVRISSSFVPCRR